VRVRVAISEEHKEPYAGIYTDRVTEDDCDGDFLCGGSRLGYPFPRQFKSRELRIHSDVPWLRCSRPGVWHPVHRLSQGKSPNADSCPDTHGNRVHRLHDHCLCGWLDWWCGDDRAGYSRGSYAVRGCVRHLAPVHALLSRGGQENE
jgi:hypothetical protein